MATTKGCHQSSVPLNLFFHRCVHSDLKPPESNAVKTTSRVVADRTIANPSPMPKVRRRGSPSPGSRVGVSPTSGQVGPIRRRWRNRWLVVQATDARRPNTELMSVKRLRGHRSRVPRSVCDERAGSPLSWVVTRSSAIPLADPTPVSICIHFVADSQSGNALLPCPASATRRSRAYRCGGLNAPAAASASSTPLRSGTAATNGGLCLRASLVWPAVSGLARG